ncbi:hypothetical protein NKH33_23515 [Mesorhizobium sp. M1182]|uniref:hypothetical protein n=1 Tax=unclassified Mesorhizobium TaxID=325217 RepID=UPI00333E1717
MEPPKGELEYIHFFCGNTEIASDLKEREPQRAALYKATAGLLRAYANIADEMDAAGYNNAHVARIKKQVEHYLNARDTVRLASNESLDLKAYEADMRHLIDTYFKADEPRKISPFDGMSLLELSSFGRTCWTIGSPFPAKSSSPASVKSRIKLTAHGIFSLRFTTREQAVSLGAGRRSD